MPTIEGYTFTVDLDNSRFMRSIQNVKKEAITLKNVMRANFQDISESAGSYAAYANKVKDAQNAINSYKQAIDQLRVSIQSEKEKQAENGSETNKSNQKILNAINTIKRYELQISSLTSQQEKAAAQANRMRTGIDELRRTTEGIVTSNNQFVRSLQESGNYFKAASINVKSLKLQHEALSAQYKSEREVTSQLSDKVRSLESDYARESSSLAKITSARARANNEVKKQTSLTGANSKETSQAKANLAKLDEEYSNQQGKLTGVSEKLSKATGELSKQATQADKTAQKLQEVERATSGLGGSRLGQGIKAIGQFDDKLRASTSHTREWAGSLKGGFMTASLAVAPLGAALGSATKQAADMQNSWISLKNIIGASGEKAITVTKNLGIMQRDASKYSKEYGYSQHDIAEQYTEMVKRGYSSEASIGSMKSMMEAARATGADFGDTVHNTTSILDAFGLRVDNVAQMGKNTNRVVNSLAVSANMTATDFKDLGEGMSYVSASAKAANQSVEGTSAALGVLSNSGIEGSRAGTGLRKVLNSLISPTQGANKALQELGLQTSDFKTKSGQLKPVSEIFKLIGDRAKSLHKTNQLPDIFHDLFGTTGQQAGLVLAQNYNQIDKIIAAEKKAQGQNSYVHQLAEKNMKSAQMSFEKLKQTVNDIAINVGKEMLPAVSKVASAFATWTVSKDGQQAIKGMTDAVGDLANGVSKHATEIINFLSGTVQGFVNTAKFAGEAGKNVADFIHQFTPLGFVLDRLHDLVNYVEQKLGGGKNNNAMAKGAGIAVGGFVAMVATLKILHKAFEGVRAISEDVGSLRSWAKGDFVIDKRKKDMEELITLQKESLDLQKKDIERNQGSLPSSKGSKGGTDVTDTINTVSDIADDVKGAKGAKVAKGAEVAVDAEKAVASGANAAKWYQKGFIGKMGGWAAKLTEFILPTSLLGKVGGWTSKVLDAMKLGFGKLNPKNWKIFSKIFSGAKVAGEAGGLEAGGGFVAKITSKIGGSKLLGLFKGGLGKLAAGITAVFDGIDLINVIRRKNSNKKWRDMGGDIGGLVGAGIGGYFGGPEGMILGEMIGKPIGRAYADMVRQSIPTAQKAAYGFGKTWDLAVNKHDWKGAWNNFVKSSHDVFNDFMKWLNSSGTGQFATWVGKTVDLVKKGKWQSAWDNTVSSFKKAWGSAVNWWDKYVLGKTSSSKPKKGSKKVTKDVVESLGGNNYSKADIANVKAMNAAITTYTKSLQTLKSTIKNNDPTKEINTMNSELKDSASKWDALAKPVKKMGDAFKNLATFTKSMAKKDGIAAMIKDLPKLSSALDKYGKKITDGIKDLSKGLDKTGIPSRIKIIDSSLSDLTSKLKTVNTPLKTTKNAFNDLNTVFKKFSSTKSNPLEIMKKGFKDLNDALSGKKGVTSQIKDLASALKDSKLDKTFDTINKPLKTMKGYFTDLKKPMNALADGFEAMNKVLNKFSSAKSNPLMNMDNALGALYNDLNKKTFGDLIKSQGDIANKALTGNNFSKKFVAETSNMTKALDSFEKSALSDWQKMFDNISKASDSGFDVLTKNQGKFTSAYEKAWTSLQSGIEKIVSKMWSNITNLSGKGVNKLISILNKGITKVDSVIAKFGGSSTAVSTISGIKYATGTGFFSGQRRPITKPTVAMLNDGNDSPETGNKEGLIRNGQLGIIQGRNVTSLLQPGDEILNASELAFLMKTQGIEYFASGTGVFDSLGSYASKNESVLKKFYDLAKKVASSPAKYLNDFVKFTGSDFKKGAIKDLASNMFKTADKQVQTWWGSLWNMVNTQLDDGGAEGGLLGAVQKYGAGKPYVWGATGPDSFDCSGLVQYALAKAFHKSFPHYSGSQYNASYAVSDPQPGDLVFFGPGGSNHVGVYAGGGNYYSAQSPAAGIGMGKVAAVNEGDVSYRRIRGLDTSADSDTGSSNSDSVKADSPLQKKIKTQVGTGFWKFISKLSDMFGIAGSLANPSGSGVLRWKNAVISALKANGFEATDFQVKSWLSVIQRESNGNPNAVNNWDSNAQRGDPSKGLVQTIGSTFNAFKFKGHNDIFNGYDDLLAGINYMKHKYGTGSSAFARVADPRIGYANGGIVSSEQVARIAENNQPEAILPLSLDKRSRALDIISQVLAQFKSEDGTNLAVNEAQQKENKMLADKLDTLIALMTDFVSGSQTTETTINIDGKKMANALSKHIRSNNTASMIKGRLGISNG